MPHSDLCHRSRPNGRRTALRCAGTIALCLSLLLLPGLLLPGTSRATSFFDGFKDPTDGQFDTSDWLLNRRGFLPVPIIITEPAIGYGGGLMLLFFHKSKKDKEKEESDELLGLPPSVSAAFGAGTENGTWMGGGGHFGTWKDDHIRFTGGAGYANMNVTFYPLDAPVNFNIQGALLSTKMEFRIRDTNLFLGAGYGYTNIDTTRESGPPLLPDQKNDTIGGISLLAHWDGRDNIFTPNDGQDFYLGATFNAPAFGGNTIWQELDYKLHSYHQVHERVVVSLRFDGSAVWGDVPFYALPFVDLRGIPALRYQGDAAGEGELDLRVRVWKRLSLVGFFGAGWTSGSITGDDGPFPAGGGGFRYLLARKLGMQVGIDVARGPEDTAFYIIMGSAW